ncbi:MAG: DinB family protein [Bryocella sp.]
MKTLRVLCFAAVAAATLAQAQVETKDPVVWAAKDVYARQAKFIVAAAEAMPADKYNFKPTEGQWSFGKIVSHVAMANSHVCAMLNDTKPPANLTISETSSKAELVSVLKASFGFCDAAMNGLTDDKLGATITFFGGRRVPRARALIEEAADTSDHYSQMAMYLRLNGITPPSAVKK